MMQPYTYDPIALQQQQMRQNQQPTIDLDDLLGTRSNRSCPQQNPVTSTTGHRSQKAPPLPTTPPPPLLNLDPFGFSQLQAAPRAIPLPLATPATRPILTAGDEDAQRLRLLRESGPICQAAHETRASAWRCTNCTYTSPKDSTKCDMCDCDREGVDPVPVVAECPPSSWKCGVCTLSNELKLEACAVCQHPQPPSTLSRKQPAPVHDSTAWECAVCTLSNRVEVEACVVCQSPHTVTGGATKPKLPDSDPRIPKNNSEPIWTCRACTFDNKMDVAHCEACAGIRPGASLDRGKAVMVWQPNDHAPCCTACRVPFTLFVRKHHCRACGQIFCARHSNNKGKLHQKDVAVVRMCDACSQQ